MNTRETRRNNKLLHPTLFGHSQLWRNNRELQPPHLRLETSKKNSASRATLNLYAAFPKVIKHFVSALPFARNILNWKIAMDFMQRCSGLLIVSFFQQNVRMLRSIRVSRLLCGSGVYVVITIVVQLLYSYSLLLECIPFILAASRWTTAASSASCYQCETFSASIIAVDFKLHSFCSRKDPRNKPHRSFFVSTTVWQFIYCQINSEVIALRNFVEIIVTRRERNSVHFLSKFVLLLHTSLPWSIKSLMLRLELRAFNAHFTTHNDTSDSGVIIYPSHEPNKLNFNVNCSCCFAGPIF